MKKVSKEMSKNHEKKETPLMKRREDAIKSMPAKKRNKKGMC